MKSIALSELKNHFDEEVTVSGFVDEVRNLKWVQFVVLRDATGKVQITIEKIILQLIQFLNFTLILIIHKFNN